MKKIILLSLLCFSLQAIAQQDLTVYELRAAPQAHLINPSKIPYARGYVLLPALSGAYLSINNTGFTYNDVFQYEDDSLHLNMDKALGSMKELNEVGFDFRTTLFGFGFRSGASFITFNVEQKLSTRFTYPKTLMEFIWKGNASDDFLDKRVPLDGLGIDYLQYTEVALGYAKDIDEKWSVGGKVKVLSGIANFQTTTSELGILTSADDYSLHLDGQFGYKTAGAMAGILDSNVEYIDAITNSLTGNLGFALDVGATYHYNDKLSFNASLIDMGLIRWTQGVINKTSKPVTYSYSGQSIDQWLSGENTEGFVNAVDSLVGQIEWTEDNQSYSTSLPLKSFIGANYQLLSRTDLNALIYNEFYNGSVRSSLRFGVTQRVRNFFMATVNYSIYGRSAANIGAGFTLNGGPWQLYFVTDNALAFAFPTAVKNYHFRMGINLTFGNNFNLN